MLQFFRRFSKSAFAILMFIVLIGSFGAWGIGDLFRGGPLESSPIEVGDAKISPDQIKAELDQGFQRMSATAAARGETLDRDEAKALGLVDHTVDTIVTRAKLDQEAARLHLRVGDAEIAQTIADDPRFKGANGAIDRAMFENTLEQNHLTEAQYVELLRGDMARQALAAPTSAPAPAALVAMILAERGEKRIADYVFLPESGVTGIAAPDAATVKDYYQKNIAAFTAPEYRGFTILVLRPEDVEGTIKVTDDKLRDLYQQDLGQFSHPEQREVKQLLAPDEATARRAAAALAQGQDFAEVARTIAGQSADTVDQGWVAKKDLLPEVAQAAFAAAQGVPTAPFKTSFGWSILRIDGTRAAGVTAFADAKPRLEAEERKEEAGDLLYELSNKVEDALAAGADLQAIAQQFNLKTSRVAALDATGHDPSGHLDLTLPVDSTLLLKSAFETPQGQTSALVEVPKTNQFFAVHIDRIIPPAPKPLDSVAQQAADAWLKDQRAAAIARRAQSLAAAVTGSSTLAAMAAARGLTVTTTEPFGRDDESGALPRDLVSKLFTLKPGEVATTAGKSGADDGQFVAVVKSVVPPDPQADKTALDDIQRRLDQDLQGELLTEFDDSLGPRYKVTIDHAAIDALY